MLSQEVSLERKNPSSNGKYIANAEYKPLSKVMWR